ncbi:Ferric/cupric reductase transmembrane component 7 [Wallemia ichthyophaga EXF-994]|uniref:Ferric/cupric reductase transmembrane component 7 n=1 Tax=Wallemia ichthyophaga (strain EXF-994 / CBS 113033) TaxID=1299270 RepID=R9A911_WALI9|nr:Ferric/cupric reductase transmembrane component 7 [Wallemia ichthyophaga EXF-994]TIA94648.1 hypothetical protein E3P95_04147 [Wallemia ichthyophaga]EOQ98651.1 Ferric/cupric reductase transmembrane component 7 [Wallemia ichthyophaga EXF-994]TIA95052.1 hypothetical protein E3P94_04148 [Wallemia ichthyophaga]TIB28107.1 hypothetical protein E3P84_04152 [Wallemia ichthyophaga]TIB38021.1 hypothetical protein E3P83_04150 [Wallemia ichthyophaga]
MAVCVPPLTKCYSSEERREMFKNKDDWWTSDRYAFNLAMMVTAILIVVIIVQSLKYIASTKRVMAMMRRSGSGGGGSLQASVVSAINRIAASARALHYHRFRIRNFYFPHTFPMILLSAIFIGTTVWAFTIFPYYRPGIQFGPGPLAIRTGWMTLGLIPPVFSMGSRINPISFITGISHERLIDYHQYGAIIILFLSLVHTIPFIVEPLQQGYEMGGGIELGRFLLQKYYDGTVPFWNGIPPLVALVWIIVSSMKIFRNMMSYEFFVCQHIVTTFFFLVWMFIHTDVTYPQTWQYLFVTVGVMAWSWFGKILVTFWANEFSYYNAQVATYSGEIIRIRIVTPLRWKAAQCIYIRFLTISPLESHPFTITSIPSNDVHSTSNVLQLILRGKSGITRKLNDKAKGGVASIPVLIDGPYGGIPRPLNGFSHVLLLSGGTGVTSNISVLLTLLNQMERSETLVEQIDFVWVVREMHSLEWFNDTFKALSTYSSFGNVNLVIHVTGQNELDEKSSSSGLAYDEKLYNFVKGRPNVKRIVRDSATQAQGRHLAVVVCGPGGLFNFDTMNECAAIEFQMAIGNQALPNQMFVHSESFEW